MTYGYLVGQWVTFHGLVVMVGLSIYVATSHTLHLRRHPSAAIAWVVALVLLPYLTLPLYLMFGIRKVRSYQSVARRNAFSMQISRTDALAVRIRQLAAVMALPAASSYQQLSIHEDGVQALQALRNMIDGAKRTIDISTFVFARDGLGKEIAQDLVRRALDGIRVRLLVDGIGAYIGGHAETGVRDFGAFVDLGGIEGMIPVSELSHTRWSSRIASGYGAEAEIWRQSISVAI